MVLTIDGKRRWFAAWHFLRKRFWLAIVIESDPALGRLMRLTVVIFFLIYIGLKLAIKFVYANLYS
jgi:hypothetical protein